MPKIQRASSQLRTLINSLPDALIVLIDESISFTNPAFLQLIGADDASQVIGHHMREFIHPCSLSRIRDQITADHRTGSRSWPMELLLVRVDGVNVPVESVGIALSSKDKRAIEVVMRDNTARKRSEEAFSDLVERVELADREALMGIWELNLEDESVTWSNEIYRQFGVERESFRGDLAAFFTHVHPNDRARVEQALAAARRGDARYDVRFRVLTPEGKIRWIESHGIVKSGKRMMIGVAHDITELKAAQARAEENEQNYRLLLNSTAEGIYGLDADGLCTFCNTAAALMLGYDNPEH